MAPRRSDDPTPEELEARLAAEEAASRPPRRSSSGSRARSVNVRVAPSLRVGSPRISVPKAGMGMRLLTATFFGILALEVISTVTGQYFNWNLGQGLDKLKTSGQYLGLYPGQAEKLAAGAGAPPVRSSGATPGALPSPQVYHPVPGVASA